MPQRRIAITPDKVLTAKAAIDYFLSDKFVPTNIFPAQFHGKSGYIFRGVSDNNANLAKVFRSPHALRGYTSQFAGQLPMPEERPKYLGWQTNAEMRAVILFLEAADKLGIDTPLDYDLLERSYREAFRVDADGTRYIHEPRFNDPFPYQEMLPGFALAQHYGVPTRLLDWTESPFVAAWFAAYRASQACPDCQRITSEYFFVHILHQKACDRSLRIVTVPRTRNRNLLAQKALFLHFPYANILFAENGKWPSLEDLLAKTGKTKWLEKVAIVTSQADTLLRLLWCLGITRESLMPSLDSAAQAFSYRRQLFSSDW